MVVSQAFIDYHGEGAVCQGDGQNVPVIFVLVAVLVRVCAGFHRLCQGQFILRVKHGLKLPLYLGAGIGLKLGRQVGGQLIGVVAQFVNVIAVLVIARVGALDIGNFIL